MIRRLYVHNFRCLENFDLPIAGKSSILLIGNNGAGKSTVSFALELLQRIARGINRVSDLVKPKDFARGRSDSPMRFELEVDLAGITFGYSIAFECPKGWKELRVYEESLKQNDRLVFSREAAKVVLARDNDAREASFFIDWHLVALPIIQQSRDDSLAVFKEWLSRILIIAPLPSLIGGDSLEETLEPNRQVSNFAAWFSGLLAHAPSAYSTIDSYLRLIMPDIKDIKNPTVGTDSRSLIVNFSNENGYLTLPFKELSDGEKCFMICAMVLAANEAYGPLLCFWDEPDNHLALSEVSHFVSALRRAFVTGGQLIVTSHNPEAIGRFSRENTLVLQRRSHLEPTLVRDLDSLQVTGNLITNLIVGDL